MCLHRPFIAQALALALTAARMAAQPVPETDPEVCRQLQIDSPNQSQTGLLEETPAKMDTASAEPSLESAILNVFREPFKGKAAARVAIVEYSDFDCPYCARYATEIYPLLDLAYIRTGKVKYFFRDLPGSEHPNALLKAQAARCAGDQNKYWAAHDRLFKDQIPFDPPGLPRFTRALGLDRKRFDACISKAAHLDAIRRGVLEARRMRVYGTPAFIIGTLSEDGSVLSASKVFLGAESYETFRTILDDLLKRQS